MNEKCILEGGPRVRFTSKWLGPLDSLLSKDTVLRKFVKETSEKLVSTNSYFIMRDSLFI